MSLLLLALLSIAVLTVGYFAYGAFIARQYRLDDQMETPAVTRNDGIDFIPTRPFYLLGQHFSAIAAAGPIAGPILACMAFGWLPCVLWILLGVVFIGAVHDFSALVASIRHGAHSVAEMAKRNLGPRAGVALIVFIWLALVYVMIAFTQITASTFVGKAEEFAGLEVPFNKGGAVAAASVLYLSLAIVMGLVQRFLKPPMWLVTVVFVPATLGCVWAGTRLDHLLNLDLKTWFAIILAYCLAASMLPVWLLQQPRGYLGGFILYLAIAIGAGGILFGGYDIQQPAISQKARELVNPLNAPQLFDPTSGVRLGDLVVPFLFVTIACGACSGFHGLVCGGTTSKQIAKESDCKPVAFGAMLLEGFVAIIALATIMILTPAQVVEKGGAAGAARIYGDGIATFIAGGRTSGAWFVFCATFGAMAFSTFVFDTLDVSTRLGRYLLQELLGTTNAAVGLLAAAATAGVPLVILLASDSDGWRNFWTLFGTSNQLLASLTLLGVTVWLYRSGRRIWYTLLPTLFIMAITLYAIGLQIAVGVADLVRSGLWSDSGAIKTTVLNAAVAIALLGLAAVFCVEAGRAFVQARAIRRQQTSPNPA